MSTRILPAAFLLALLLSAGARAAYYGPPLPEPGDDKGDAGIFVVDGSAVHNVGEVHLNITNWGLIGSMPGVVSSFEASPSAMWPAGSGVDYLFAAGLWVGAIKNGVPLVSTGQFDRELLPTSDPLDTIYKTGIGEPGGARYPFPDEDDDHDGRANEETLDGRDNDGDGQVDEDFAVIGEQHFRLVMRDDSPVAEAQWPDHEPLGIEVVQESYQWSKPELENAIAFDYTIRNVGGDVLENVTVGFFVDADVGSRARGSVAADDMVGIAETVVTASDGLPLFVSIAYAYDCDGDDGEAPGYLGFMFINSSPVPTPQAIGTFSFFTGTEPFEDGGDPTNDAERYALMTGGGRGSTLPVDCTKANDYRMLLSIRPSGGGRFGPGARLRFQTAIVMGTDVDDLVRNASEIAVHFYGQWFNRDGDFTTGLKGRERKVCRSQFGDALFDLYVDCGFPREGQCGSLPPRPYLVEANLLDDEACAWINGDCAYEISRGATCGLCRGDPDVPPIPGRPLPCTGMEGKEYNVRWLSDPPPPAPDMRIWATDNRIHLFWDSESEEEVDVRTGQSIFESYRIWRSDGWTRPLGSSVQTGPASDSWTLIAEFDKVDTYENRVGDVIEEIPLGRNTGLDLIDYVPAVLTPGGTEAIRFAPLANLVDRMLLERPELDVDTRIRHRESDGTTSPLGHLYPELSEWECCYDQLDTLQWSRFGRHFYEYIDDSVLNGFLYFHALTVATLNWGGEQGARLPLGYGTPGSPRVNFALTIPQAKAQSAEDYRHHGVATYVVPNPATNQSMGEFSKLDPNQDDPTGVHIEFRSLPRARNVVQIFTLAGDLVATLSHDGRDGSGALPWNLVTRNGQQIVSGIYLFTVESDDPAFDRQIGRFVVMW